MNLRVNVLLDQETYQLVTELADAQGTSRALILRGLVKAARPHLKQRLHILTQEPDIFAPSSVQHKGRLAKRRAKKATNPIRKKK